MPGGIEGVRAMIGDFHRRGVRVFFPVMPWDTGTRQEGRTLAEAGARLMKEIGADGINGDTMNGLGREFRQAADTLGHPLALEPEIELKDPPTACVGIAFSDDSGIIAHDVAKIMIVRVPSEEVIRLAADLTVKGSWRGHPDDPSLNQLFWIARIRSTTKLLGSEQSRIGGHGRVSW